MLFSPTLDETKFWQWCGGWIHSLASLLLERAGGAGLVWACRAMAGGGEGERPVGSLSEGARVTGQSVRGRMGLPEALLTVLSSVV